MTEEAQVGKHLCAGQLRLGEMDPTQAAHTLLIAVTNDLADMHIFKIASSGIAG